MQTNLSFQVQGSLNDSREEIEKTCSSLLTSTKEIISDRKNELLQQLKQVNKCFVLIQ